MSWWIRNDGEVVDFDGDGPTDQQPDEPDDNPEPPPSSGPSPRRGNPGRSE